MRAVGDSPRRGGRNGAKKAPAGPVWARPDTRRRPALTREAIVEAAVRIADAEGLDAVSIRRVAAELAARTMSLYTHIDSKADLLDLMADHIAGEVLVDGALPPDWREAISLISRKEREAAHRHPWAGDLLNQRTHAMIGPNGLRHLEQSMAAVSGLRLDPAETWRVIAAINDYVFGYVVREVREREIARRDGLSGTERQALIRPYLQRLIDSGELVTIAPLLRDGVPIAGDDFEQGLNWLLDGIERQYGERARGATGDR